jgi:hypothetical protein
MRTGNARSAATIPLIYAVGVPLLLLDLWVTGYQRICFPVYGIPRVRRGAYFPADRHKLPYLTPIEKLHCAYCGYATGVIAYVGEVTSRTEAYWCPIRHRRTALSDHARTATFFRYGDAAAYRHGLIAVRRRLAHEPTTRSAA